MEVIDLGVENLEPIQINFNDSIEESRPSVNFGSGIEFFMNDKAKNANSSTDYDLGDLDRLEDELNDLNSKNSGAGAGAGGNSGFWGGGSSGGETKTLSGFANNLFGLGDSSTRNVHFSASQDTNEGNSRIGQATMESMGNTKSWDGFGKLDSMNLSAGGGSAAHYEPSPLNEREKRRKKRAMISKLEEWTNKGMLKHSVGSFTMDSSYEEVEDAYEGALEDKRKRDSVKIQQNWFITLMNSIEYANAAFNPFDLNLDGLGEQISEDIDSYDEIFEELHEKYKGGKLSPELSLLLRIGFAASVVHFSNKALSTATPGFNDIIRQSPELMKAFTNATVDSMKGNHPGFAFANELMNNGKPNMMSGPPPSAMNTRDIPPSMMQGGGGGGVPAGRQMQFTEQRSNRPDIQAGRGPMFREQGVDLGNNYEKVDVQERSMRPPAPVGQTMRPEMQGPRNTDIDAILNGLKPAPSQVPAPVSAPMRQNIVQDDDNESVISISSLKDLTNPTQGGAKRRGRKPRSERNVISLDI